VQKTRARGTYGLRLVFSARDNTDGNAVTYRVGLLAGYQELALKNGVTTAGTASVSISVRPPKATRSAKLTVTASDPLGNESSRSRSVRLPG